jgi:hypothetical protein
MEPGFWFRIDEEYIIYPFLNPNYTILLTQDCEVFI